MQTNPAHQPVAAPSNERSKPGEPLDLARDSLDPSDDGPLPRSLLDVAVFLAIAVLLLVHLMVEIFATAFAILAAARLWLRWVAARRALERRVEELRGRLRSANEDTEKWRAEAHEALEGLGAAIERQCDRWALTEAERAVAVLLLKGLSMKEIADARGTAERTARQQALAVYRKAGLGGRAELSAYFLEDLLLPSARSPGK
jgi:DNA-binding CsgD family transcriptional regulator